MNLDLRGLMLVVHIASGAAALVLAGAVMAAGSRQNWATRVGQAYVIAVCLVAGSALALVVAGSELAAGVRVLLGVVAVLTALAALIGWHLAPRDPSAAMHGRAEHLRLMWASVTALVAAVAVVSTPPPVWITVVIAGTLITERSYRRVRRDQAFV